VNKKMWRVVFIKEIDDTIIVRYKYRDIVMPKKARLQILMDVLEKLDRDEGIMVINEDVVVV